jgi:hypothetical protein
MSKQMILGSLTALALLAGCTAVQNLLPPAPKTTAQSVYEIKGALVSAEDAALAYETTACPVVRPCTAPGAAEINQAIVTADSAVNVAEAAVKSGSTATSAIAIAQAAIQALQALVTQYAPPTPAASTTTPALAGAAASGAIA